MPLETAYRIKMSGKVAAYTKGRPVVALKMPLIFPTGQHLFMVEWAGGPTGRADLCRVIGTDGNLLVLDRSWCWQQGKLDDDLSQLSLTTDVSYDKMIDASVIPVKEKNNACNKEVT
jgi:hypothetical protein